MISKGEKLNIYAEGNDAEQAINHITAFLDLKKV